MQEELLGLFFRLAPVDRGQDDGSDLQQSNDDDEEAVSSQKDAGLLDGTAVAKEADDEDKCTRGNENVSTLLNHGRLCQLLQKIQFIKRRIHCVLMRPIFITISLLQLRCQKI